MSRFLLRLMPHNLAARIAAALVLVGLLPILVAWGVNVAQSRGPKAVDPYALLLADYAAQSVHHELEEGASAVQAVAQDSVVRAGEGKEALEDRLRHFNDLYPLFQHLTLVGLDGQTRASSTYRYRGEWERRDVFQRARSGEIAISPAYLPSGGGEPVVSFAAPVRNARKEIAGVLVGEVPISYVASLVTGLRLGKEGYAFLLNSVGQVIAHPDIEHLMESLVLAGPGEAGGPLLFISQEGGESHLYAVAPVATGGMPEQWQVVLQAPTAEAYAYYFRTQRIILLSSLGALLTVGLVAAGLAHSISRPVRQVSAAARRLAAGDLSARVEGSPGGELGELAIYFNAMAQKLQAKVQDLQKSRSRIVTGQEAVRREIAGHLHGHVQGKLLVLKARLQEALSDGGDPAARAERMASLIADMDQVIGQELSGLSRRLYPSILRRGLVPALQSLADQFEGVLKVDMRLEEAFVQREKATPHLIPEPVRLAAYRIAEEALTNVVKHAGASQVTVQLEQPGEQTLRLIVRDDGQGFDIASASSGLGLAAMQDYTEAVGGQCVIHSTPGRGTEVTAILPLSGPGGEPPETISPWR